MALITTCPMQSNEFPRSITIAMKCDLITLRARRPSLSAQASSGGNAFQIWTTRYPKSV